MGIHRVPRVYVTPKGQLLLAREREKLGVRQVYTLVFDDDGYVIDMLYDDKASGLPALQMQHHKATNV